MKITEYEFVWIIGFGVVKQTIGVYTIILPFTLLILEL